MYLELIGQCGAYIAIFYPQVNPKYHQVETHWSTTQVPCFLALPECLVVCFLSLTYLFTFLQIPTSCYWQHLVFMSTTACCNYLFIASPTILRAVTQLFLLSPAPETSWALWMAKDSTKDGPGRIGNMWNCKAIRKGEYWQGWKNRKQFLSSTECWWSWVICESFFKATKKSLGAWVNTQNRSEPIYSLSDGGVRSTCQTANSLEKIDPRIQAIVLLQLS